MTERPNTFVRVTFSMSITLVWFRFQVKPVGLPVDTVADAHQ